MIKVKDRKLLLLPGDGIGPEVVREVRKIISGLSEDASTNCLKHIAGRKFANNFNSFLSFKRALSGLLENSKLSYLGPPTAPKITASLSSAL